MAASLKVSELLSLTSVAASDLILIADVDATASKKTTFAQLQSSISLANLGTKSISNLSDVDTSGISDGQYLAWSNTNSRFEPVNAAGTTVQTIQRSTDATHYLTFVDSDNVSATDESIYTDAGVTYNPSSNLLTVGELSATTLDIGGTNITATAAELNILDGVTSTADELNILDGVTATTAELNILDGVTATTTELNILDGVTATTTELNYVDGVTSAIQTQLDAKQSTVTAGDGLEFTGATLSVDLATSIIANESFTLSGMTDSTHNDTYHMVYRSGSKFKATINQSGSNIEINTDREGEYFLTISGTGVAAIDGETLSVHKHTGYLTVSVDTYTWSTGSTDGNFHWYYWDSTDQIFVAYDTTNNEWKAFDLSQATGGAASFISDLDSTGSTAGYLSGGENFTLTSGNIASLTASSDTYPSEITKIPAAADSNVTYASADSHPYYVFQNTAANKWVAFTPSSSFYWTAWHRSAAFDLSTEVLTDDATAFTLDDSSDFEYITTASDDYGDGTNIPDAADSNVTYLPASTGAYLEFDSGELKAQVKDEDNMASDSAEHLATQQSIKAYVDTTTAANETHIDNLVTLSGVAKDATDLGTFTGTTISDNGDLKTVLQELETQLESVAGGGAQATSVETQSTSTDATHYITFVTDNNGSATQENIYTDAGLSYNPSSNLLSAGGDLTVAGDLTVNGTTTTVNSTQLDVEDKNITLGNVSTPTDTTADGGGLTILGATDKTLNWVNATAAFTSSEHLDLASGKEYYINNASVLSSTTLGSTVVNSSLTSVGTIATGVWNGTAIATAYIADDAVTADKLADTAVTAAGYGAAGSVGTFTVDAQGRLTAAADVAISITESQISDLQSYLTSVSKADVGVDHLETLTGAGADAEDLGTFTGTVITDNSDIKTALQALEVSIESEHPVLVEAYNATGADLTKGKPVYISGTHVSGKPEVTYADADGAGTHPAIGLVADTTSTANDVNVIISGTIDGLDTSSWSVGDALYLDTTAGDLTNTRPTSSSVKVQKVGIVTKSDASTGSILIIGAGRTNDVPNELTALTGVNLNALDLGTFTGTIITDNSSIKTALQALETEVENLPITNLDIDGGTAGTIGSSTLFIADENGAGTNTKVTSGDIANYVAGSKTVKQLANVGTVADTEPSSYYFLVVDASTGDIKILDKSFVVLE